MKIKFSKPGESIAVLNSDGSVQSTFDDWANIPTPYPAKKSIPQWYKETGNYDKKSNLIKTVKKCPPFLDAFTTGYIIPFASECHIKIKEQRQVTYGGPGTMFLSMHVKAQYESSPWKDKIVMKYSSPWIIETPPGWSCLFLHPLNDDNANFSSIAGIVDTDTYRLPVNFPFLVTAQPGAEFTLTKDTPMIQVIPFFRQEWEHEVKDINVAEWQSHQKAIGDGWDQDGYKDLFHQKKKFT